MKDSKNGDDWLSLYLKYTDKQESPVAFHLWTGITTIAAALGRDTWIDRGFYTIYPGQVMTILVAGSAKLRKSTAVKIGVNRILKVAQTSRVVEGKASPEAFIDSINFGMEMRDGKQQAVPSQALIFASELSDFLSKQAYMEAMIPLLTNLADAPDTYTYKTRTHGEIVLSKVCLTFLGATTPDWLAEAIPANSFGGGFMSRIIFVYCDKAERVNPFPELSDIDEKLEKELIQQLKDMKENLRGEMVISPFARERWGQWYEGYMLDDVQTLDGYWGRKPDHSLRVAGILAASEYKNVIEPDHIDRSLDLLKEIEDGLPSAFQFVGATSISREQELVYKLIKNSGGEMSLQEIMHKMWRRTDMSIVEQCLRTLVGAGLVIAEAFNNTIIYRVSEKEK